MPLLTEYAITPDLLDVTSYSHRGDLRPPLTTIDNHPRPARGRVARHTQGPCNGLPSGAREAIASQK